METGECLLVNEDAAAHGERYGNPAVLQGEAPKSTLWVPMLQGGLAMGVISLQNLDREQAFSEADVRLLQTLSNSMSVALENARLFDQTQRLRRFYLLGQTVDSMRTWDIRRGVQAVKQIAGLEKKPLWIQAQREMAANALYASLFEDGISRLDLHDLPTTHRQGPAYLNVLKYLDLPQAAAMAAEKTRVILYSADEKAWAYPTSIVKLLGLPEKQWQIRKPLAAE